MPDGFITTLGDEDALRIIVKQQRKEIDRLKEAIRRLADQDATLSFCGGDVTVTVDESPRWIPAGERLPPKEESVLYTCWLGPNEGWTDVSFGRWECGYNDNGNPAMRPIWGDEDDWEPCTHWMPCPEPPATATEQT